MYSFYEFFAGGGMARLGLGERWECLFANDISPKKASTYEINFPNRPDRFKLADVSRLKVDDLPERADLAWGSFPCQDLSLAGNGAGLAGSRSGVFWHFWKLIEELEAQDRHPALVVIENVEGALTSHDGKDFRAIVCALADAGYLVGALTIDAIHFVPQSRPRLFLVAVQADHLIPAPLRYTQSEFKEMHVSPWHSESLRSSYQSLTKKLQESWIWWRMPAAKPRTLQLNDVLEPDSSVCWNTREATHRLISLMSPVNLEKLRKARIAQMRLVGCVYKRTREGTQRAEVRFDGISGCLRTPGGGSSRQTILVVEGSTVKSRLLSTREAARLMGLPESYMLPENYNDAYHIAGDGLVVPVVSWLERFLLTPLMIGAERVPTLIRHEMFKERNEYVNV